MDWLYSFINYFYVHYYNFSFHIYTNILNFDFYLIVIYYCFIMEFKISFSFNIDLGNYFCCNIFLIFVVYLDFKSNFYNYLFRKIILLIEETDSY